MRRFSIVLAVCTSALVLCPTGIAFAQEAAQLPSPGITPDSPFYFWDELAEQIAESIISYRAGSMEGMQSVADLLRLQFIDIDTFRQIENNITTRSDVFTIRCFSTATRGEDMGITLMKETVVDRSTSPYGVFYSYQGASY